MNPIALRKERAKEVFKLYNQIIEHNNKNQGKSNRQVLGKGMYRVQNSDGTTTLYRPMQSGFF